MAYEKKLPGCTIYYLHDSDKCKKCIPLSEFENDRSYQKFEPKQEIPSEESLVSNNYKPMLKELLLGAEKALKSEFVFSEPLKIPTELLLKQPKVVLKRLCIEDLKRYGSTKIPSYFKKKQNNKVRKRVTKRTKQQKKKYSKAAAKKKTPALKKPVRKQASNSGSKGTMKRRRFFLNKYSEENNGYEDDLFEDKNFEHFQTLLRDESGSSENFEEIETPIFPYSFPETPRAVSPTIQDSYSPTQLSLYRKNAEEYMYRRKRRKLNFKETREETPQVESISQEYDDVQQRLEEVARLLKEQKSVIEMSSDSEEDQYFSDV